MRGPVLARVVGWVQTLEQRYARPPVGLVGQVDHLRRGEPQELRAPLACDFVRGLTVVAARETGDQRAYRSRVLPLERPGYADALEMRGQRLRTLRDVTKMLERVFVSPDSCRSTLAAGPRPPIRTPRMVRFISSSPSSPASSSRDAFVSTSLGTASSASSPSLTPPPFGRDGLARAPRAPAVPGLSVHAPNPSCSASLSPGHL